MKVGNSPPLDEGNMWEVLHFMMVSNFLVAEISHILLSWLW
jgi:hypothetical protein